MPPSDEEVFWYLGPQKRWVSLCMTLSFGLAGLSILKFASRSLWLTPLLMVLTLNVAAAAIAMFSGLNRRKITRSQHVWKVSTWNPADVPSVDVFLPTCGEPLDMLRNTYHHASHLDWDGDLRVLVLDDADRAEVAELAREYGFDYVVRPNRGYLKKAGNLLHAFGVSGGDFIAIFDADFCPRPDYLRHLVPYMDDQKTGIVQSPQCFDTSPGMSWLQRTAGATQELFYRWVQPSRDAAGAPICVGTNAIYRRSALDRIGGFAQIEHSEDVHTGIALLRQGFTTRYVPVLVAKGLCPDDLGAFLNQQYRWCNGSITLLKSGNAHRRPLTLRQRLCFWAGFMYYITTAANIFTVHLAGIIMAFFYPQEIKPSHYVPFLAGVWVYLVLLPRVFKSRWRFEVLRVQMAYSFSHSIAILHKLTGRSASWEATGAIRKGNNLARTISRVGVITLTVGVGLSWLGIVVDLPTQGLGNLWPMILFVSGYTYLSVPLAVDFVKLLAADRAARRSVELEGRDGNGGLPTSVFVYPITEAAGGAA
jgi:cellulose synthase (UDP-forming)